MIPLMIFVLTLYVSKMMAEFETLKTQKYRFYTKLNKYAAKMYAAAYVCDF